MLVAAPSEIRETGELVSRSSLARSASDEVLPDWHLGRPGRRPGRPSVKGERLFFNRSPSRAAQRRGCVPHLPVFWDSRSL